MRLLGFSMERYPFGSCQQGVWDVQSMTARGELKRNRILAVAREMLLEGGPDAVVLRDVAQKLGTTHGNLQHYFPTRQSLLVAVLDREITTYIAALRDSVARAKTSRGRLLALIESGFQLARAPEASLWRAVVGMLDHSPEIAALHLRELDSYGRAIDAELKGIAPALKASQRRQLVDVMQILISGMGVLAVHDERRGAWERDSERLVKRLVLTLVETG
jgi:AcrR family transcriptional regulator